MSILDCRALRLTAAFLASFAAAPAAPGVGEDPVAPLRPFLEQNCLACHGAAKIGGLDLTAMPLGPDHAETFDQWVRVRDRVEAGEMPPPKAPAPAEADRQAFVAKIDETLLAIGRQRQSERGRVFGRRLTRYEYERTVQDLLGIAIPLEEYLPADSRADGFDTVASAQQISHFVLEKYLGAADIALDEAYARAFKPAPQWWKQFENQELTGSGGNNRSPIMRDDGTVVSWSTSLIFVGRMLSTTVKETGWYQIRVEASAVNPDPSGRVWAMLRSGVCYAKAPLMYWIGELELTPEPKVYEFNAWIREGHMLELNVGDRTYERPNYNDVRDDPKAAEAKGTPGAVIHSLEMARIFPGASKSEAREILFGDLPVVDDRVVTENPQADLGRLVGRFASRAFRRPVEADEVEPYAAIGRQALAEGDSFAEAVRGAYRAVLTSPRFLYLTEKPGRLDDHELASRLSYFLWSAPPDAELRAAADAGRLSDPAERRAQVERMLADPKFSRFLDNFLGQWLDLHDIDFTVPDRTLYPEFDDIVKSTMVAETRLFFRELIEKDLGVSNLVDSDFTILNQRLAKHYGLGDDFQGMGYQKVALPPDSPRGGLLTHGSVLKVTANGTTTSPVLRGVWVTERILGEHVPPPPPNVGAVEPDIRGAKTIREQLAMHRDNAACAACHAKIDPPGFALESFDPAGAYRERYAAMVEEELDNGRVRQQRTQGPPVDPSYSMPSGETFETIEDFKGIVLDDRQQLARNMASQLLAYATGARIGFPDRPVIDTIMARTKSNDYGLRSMVHAVVDSPLFLNK